MKTISSAVVFKRIILALVIMLTIVFIFAPIASAVSKGYATDDDGLTPGMVVALSEHGTAEKPKVERATLDFNQKVIGVTVALGDDTVTVASAQSVVYVQNSGEAEVFVADLNGVIKSGDLLAPSPLLGILMKADESTAPIVGIALEDSNTQTGVDKEIVGSEGKRQVKISKIKINLDHKAASNQQASATDSSLERLGRAVAGKDVGEIQVITALVVFLAVLVAEGGIIYGAVSSAISALGRNPMAKKIIRKEMVRVVFIAFGVLVIGVAAIYAILWI